MGSLELPRTGNEKALKLSSEQSGWLWKKPVVWWAITENPRCFHRHCRCPVDFGWLPSSHRSTLHHSRRPSMAHCRCRSVDVGVKSQSKSQIQYVWHGFDTGFYRKLLSRSSRLTAWVRDVVGYVIIYLMCVALLSWVEYRVEPRAW